MLRAWHLLPERCPLVRERSLPERLAPLPQPEPASTGTPLVVRMFGRPRPRLPCGLAPLRLLLAVIACLPDESEALLPDNTAGVLSK